MTLCGAGVTTCKLLALVHHFLRIFLVAVLVAPWNITPVYTPLSTSSEIFCRTHSSARERRSASLRHANSSTTLVSFSFTWLESPPLEGSPQLITVRSSSSAAKAQADPQICCTLINCDCTSELSPPLDLAQVDLHLVSILNTQKDLTKHVKHALKHVKLIKLPMLNACTISYSVQECPE